MVAEWIVGLTRIIRCWTGISIIGSLVAQSTAEGIGKGYSWNRKTEDGQMLYAISKDIERS